MARRVPPRKLTLVEMMDFQTGPLTERGCRLWLGGVDAYGYGQFQWNKKKGKAHRLAWELVHGPIPDGICVCHKCDVRSCVEESHLFLGTNADNTADKVAKGRQPCGEHIATSKLRSNAVSAILRDQRGVVAVAKEFGVSPSLICMIRNRRIWKHVPLFDRLEGR